MKTSTQRFTKGARVKVVQFEKAPREDRGVQGRHGEFVEYTSRGYARIVLDALPNESPDPWLIHPENLIEECLCSVVDCGFYANDESDYCPSHF